MGTITFDYDTWDKRKDLLLHRPGNSLGYTAILTSLQVGDMLTVRKRKEDTLIRECEEGVIGLIAGGLEWLRQRGYSAEEVQNKVKAYKQGNLDRQDQTALQDVQEEIQEISNPNARRLADTVVIG